MNKKALGLEVGKTPQRFSAIFTNDLGLAIRHSTPNSYSMELTPNDAKAVMYAVNQGIDSHLEACNVPARGDRFFFAQGRLRCEISQDSLPVLVRRLMEMDNETANDLASSICQSINIELI